MYRILFICAGNYYRSRFAEIVFNRLAESHGLAAHATSRGLATELCRDFPGVISPYAIDALQAMRLTCESVNRPPTQLSQDDLSSADRIIALKEAEHRPLLAARYAGWEDRVSYWHIHDLDGALPAVALKEVEFQVRQLIDELSKGRITD